VQTPSTNEIKEGCLYKNGNLLTTINSKINYLGYL